MGDNRVFNVNGKGEDMLLKALQLAFSQESENCTCSGWQQTADNGLILCWSNSDDKIKPMPADLNAEQCLPFVTEWLKSKFAKTVKLGDWCGDAGHDGHNGGGWQVYVEDWGHVGDQSYSICAIRPAFIWYGK